VDEELNLLKKKLIIKVFGLLFIAGFIVGFLLLGGCTVRVSGEMSIMKKWDRPEEVYTVKQETAPQAPAVDKTK